MILYFRLTLVNSARNSLGYLSQGPLVSPAFSQFPDSSLSRLEGKRKRIRWISLKLICDQD